jgi:hypothetical protein
MMSHVMSPLVVLVCLSGVIATPSFAQSTKAKAKVEGPRSIPIKRAFQFYDIYLGLPPQDRDGLRLTYTFRTQPGSPRPQLSYAMGATRIPIELAADGKVLNLPNAALFESGTIEVPAGQPRMGVGLEIEPMIALARTMSVAAVTNPITDYAAATRRAGPLAAFAPKLTAIRFIGGTNGEVVFADGRRASLPAAPEGGVVFKPSAPAMRGAASISFGTAPSSAEYAR